MTTTFTLTYTTTDDEDGIVRTVEVKRTAEDFTRNELLDAVEDLLRGVGFRCDPESLAIDDGHGHGA